MNAFQSPQKIRPEAVWVALVAGGLGFILNGFPVSLGNDLHLIFGGILPVIVAIAFGPVWGLVAATLAALETILLWQHGLAIPFFAAEAFAVGRLARRRRLIPLFADAVFWAVASPLLYLVHVRAAFYPDNLGSAVALKYVVNGLLCVTVADLCLGMPKLGRLLARYGATVPEDTLAARLARVLTLAAVVPVCFLAIWYARSESDRRLAEAESELSAQARLTAGVLGDKTEEMRRAVAVLADRLGDLQRDPSAVAREVGRFHTRYPVFKTLIVTNAAGDILIGSPFPPPEKVNVADRSYFKAAMATRAPYVSEGFRGRGYGSDLLVAFSAPILSPDGAAQGVVEGSVTVEKLSEAMSAILEHGSPIVVVDQASQVLLTTRPDLFPPLTKSPIAAAQAQDRMARFDTSSPSRKVPESGLILRFWMRQAVEPKTQWRCYALAPFSVIRGRAAMVFIPVLISIPFVLFVATWASTFTARLVMRPINELAESARAIAGSPDLLYQAKTTPPRDAQRLPLEIAQLTEAFQAMAAKLGETLERLRQTNIEREIARQRLEETRAGLERELAARTAEIERREAGRLQSQKLESLGRLTGGIAHNFNNLLTVILSYSSLELDRRATDDRSRKGLLAIRRAAERGRDLVRQLMSYSRANDAGAAVYLPLHDSLRAVQSMAEKLLGEDIEMTMSLAAGDVAVCAVPQELEQVFLNLLINARDAMPKGGAIAVETTLVADCASESGGAWIPSNADLEALLARQSVARVSVRDTGTGMTPETMSRLCEPFFTTKEQGKGTGLGLSTVFGAVTSAGGFLRVESEIGKGSVFHVYLPVTDKASESANSGSRRLSFIKPSERALQALVVEDERDVREAVTTALAAAGFSVVEARDGAEALGIVQRQAGRFDLVVSDVRMPGVNGVKLASSIREQYPSLPVLFISGYADKQDTGQHFVFEDNLLYKPFTAAEIVEKARSLVDKARQ